MVRVQLEVGHPGYNPKHFGVTLPQLPRTGEYIRADAAMLRQVEAGKDDDLLYVRAIVHESSGSEFEATLHVSPASGIDILELFEET